jgi:glucosylceramidase
VWPQNALLTVDTATKTLNITPTYYVFRHCSQFVTPGAKVVGTSGGDAVAFKNPDGSIVAVMYNAGPRRWRRWRSPATSCSSRCPATGGPP